MDNVHCKSNCKDCFFDGCCVLQYARSVGISEEHVRKMSKLSHKASEKIKKHRIELEDRLEKSFSSGLDELYASAVGREGDNFLDRFPQPEIFNLVQSYQALNSAGDSFDLKDRYYQLEAGMVIKNREIFERRIVAGDILALRVHSLILQRADQLVRAVNGNCAKDGICEKCWISEFCNAKAERRR